MSSQPPSSSDSAVMTDRHPLLQRAPIWKFQSSLTPWSILFYPVTTVQTRSVCLSYLRPAGSAIPDWMPRNSVPQKPPVLASCRTDPNNITASVISGTIKSFQLVVSHEGWLGLYRGFGTFLLHGVMRDLLVYGSLRLLYVPIRNTFQFVERNLKDFYRRLRPTLVPAAAAAKSPAVADSPSDVCPNSQVSLSPQPSLSPVMDIPHILVKAIADTLTYPLLVIGTRLTVYEGPEAISFCQMLDLSWTFDGLLGGLYCGFAVNCLVRLADDIVELVCMKLCKRRKLTWAHTLTIRAGTFTILGSLTTPLATLGLIQRTQSAIPGLCTPSIPAAELLRRMPWKLLTLNVMFTTLIAGCNIALFLAEGRPTSVDTEAEEQT